MFRPNRIGTPHIHTSDGGADTTDFTLNQVLYDNAATPFNVINSTPIGDFGRRGIIWTGTEGVLAARKYALVGQFTVTAPIAGDTVGVEVQAGYTGLLPSDVAIIPIFFRLSAAIGTVLGGAANAYDQPTVFAPKDQYLIATAQSIPRNDYFKEIFIIRNTDPAILAGTYGVGFQFMNAGSVGYNITNFFMTFAVRQLNDQNDVGYRDTLR